MTVEFMQGDGNTGSGIVAWKIAFGQMCGDSVPIQEIQIVTSDVPMKETVLMQNQIASSE